MTEAPVQDYAYDYSKQDYDYSGSGAGGYYYDYGAPMEIVEGVCSANTEQLLTSREECGFALRQQTNLIFTTLQLLLQVSCNTDTVTNLLNEIVVSRDSTNRLFEKNETNRLVPLELVTEYEDATLSTNLNFGKGHLPNKKFDICDHRGWGCKRGISPSTKNALSRGVQKVFLGFR